MSYKWYDGQRVVSSIEELKKIKTKFSDTFGNTHTLAAPHPGALAVVLNPKSNCEIATVVNGATGAENEEVSEALQDLRIMTLGWGDDAPGTVDTGATLITIDSTEYIYAIPYLYNCFTNEGLRAYGENGIGPEYDVAMADCTAIKLYKIPDEVSPLSGCLYTEQQLAELEQYELFMKGSPNGVTYNEYALNNILPQSQYFVYESCSPDTQQPANLQGFFLFRLSELQREEQIRLFNEPYEGPGSGYINCDDDSFRLSIQQNIANCYSTHDAAHTLYQEIISLKKQEFEQSLIIEKSTSKIGVIQSEISDLMTERSDTLALRDAAEATLSEICGADDDCLDCVNIDNMFWAAECSEEFAQLFTTTDGYEDAIATSKEQICAEINRLNALLQYYKDQNEALLIAESLESNLKANAESSKNSILYELANKTTEFNQLVADTDTLINELDASIATIINQDCGCINSDIVVSGLFAILSRLSITQEYLNSAYNDISQNWIGDIDNTISSLQNDLSGYVQQIAQLNADIDSLKFNVRSFESFVGNNEYCSNGVWIGNTSILENLNEVPALKAEIYSKEIQVRELEYLKQLAESDIAAEISIKYDIQFFIDNTDGYLDSGQDGFIFEFSNSTSVMVTKNGYSTYVEQQANQGNCECISAYINILEYEIRSIPETTSTSNSIDGGTSNMFDINGYYTTQLQTMEQLRQNECLDSSLCDDISHCDPGNGVGVYVWMPDMTLESAWNRLVTSNDGITEEAINHTLELSSGIDKYVVLPNDRVGGTMSSGGEAGRWVSIIPMQFWNIQSGIENIRTHVVSRQEGHLGCSNNISFNLMSHSGTTDETMIFKLNTGAGGDETGSDIAKIVPSQKSENGHGIYGGTYTPYMGYPGDRFNITLGGSIHINDVDLTHPGAGFRISVYCGNDLNYSGGSFPDSAYIANAQQLASIEFDLTNLPSSIQYMPRRFDIGLQLEPSTINEKITECQSLEGLKFWLQQQIETCVDDDCQQYIDQLAQVESDIEEAQCDLVLGGSGGSNPHALNEISEKWTSMITSVSGCRHLTGVDSSGVARVRETSIWESNNGCTLGLNHLKEWFSINACSRKIIFATLQWGKEGYTWAPGPTSEFSDPNSYNYTSVSLSRLTADTLVSPCGKQVEAQQETLVLCHAESYTSGTNPSTDIYACETGLCNPVAKDANFGGLEDQTLYADMGPYFLSENRDSTTLNILSWSGGPHHGNASLIYAGPDNIPTLGHTGWWLQYDAHTNDWYGTDNILYQVTDNSNGLNDIALIHVDISSVPDAPTTYEMHTELVSYDTLSAGSVAWESWIYNGRFVTARLIANDVDDIDPATGTLNANPDNILFDVDIYGIYRGATGASGPGDGTGIGAVPWKWTDWDMYVSSGDLEINEYESPIVKFDYGVSEYYSAVRMVIPDGWYGTLYIQYNATSLDDGLTSETRTHSVWVPPKLGCTSPDSCNYDELAHIDDGSCVDTYTCYDGTEICANEAPCGCPGPILVDNVDAGISSWGSYSIVSGVPGTVAYDIGLASAGEGGLTYFLTIQTQDGPGAAIDTWQASGTWLDDLVQTTGWLVTLDPDFTNNGKFEITSGPTVPYCDLKRIKFDLTVVDSCGFSTSGWFGIETQPVTGCMDPAACTYDVNATCDSGDCQYLDDCGECGGTNDCLDCNGDADGTAYLDNCGNCVGGNTGQEPCVQDCIGDWGGTAYLNDCGICVGGNTGLEDDAGKDECGDCGGSGLEGVSNIDPDENILNVADDMGQTYTTTGGQTDLSGNVVFNIGDTLTLGYSHTSLTLTENQQLRYEWSASPAVDSLSSQTGSSVSFDVPGRPDTSATTFTVTVKTYVDCPADSATPSTMLKGAVTYTMAWDIDCANVVGGDAVVDECGNCTGDDGYLPPSGGCCPGDPAYDEGVTVYPAEGNQGKPCDCNDPTRVWDAEGNCIAPQEVDCAGVEGGTAFIDDCGACAGGETGIEPYSSTVEEGKRCDCEDPGAYWTDYYGDGQLHCINPLDNFGSPPPPPEGEGYEPGTTVTP